MIRLLLLSVLLLSLIPSLARGQTLRGRVLDSDSSGPIDGVSVALVDSQEEAVTGVLTNPNGIFILTAPRTGRYRVRLERIGYENTTGPEIDLLPPDTLEVEMRMSVAAVEIAPLTIKSARAPLVMDTRLASWGFYDRRAHYKRLGSGLTHFLTLEDIRRRNPMRMTDIFRDLAGIRVGLVLDRGRLVQLPAGRLEGERDRGGGSVPFDSGGSERVAQVHPQDSNHTQWVRGFGLLDDLNCGLVVFWTRQGW